MAADERIRLTQHTYGKQPNIQHTHNIRDFNSPSFKILIDYNKKEKPTSWQEFINRTMDTL